MGDDKWEEELSYNIFCIELRKLYDSGLINDDDLQSIHDYAIEHDFIEDISFTQAGIVEVIERQVDGYIGITAY